jgi:hypothetical protein
METLLREWISIQRVWIRTDSCHSALEWGPWQWQSTQFYSVTNNGYTPYYRFCDYVENVWPNSTNEVPGARGVGLTKALHGYAKYIKQEFIPGCAISLPFPSSH